MSDMQSSTALHNILVILRGPHCCCVVSKKETCVSLYWINKKAHSKGFSWTCVHRVIYYISAEKAKQNHFKTTIFLTFSYMTQKNLSKSFHFCVKKTIWFYGVNSSSYLCTYIVLHLEDAKSTFQSRKQSFLVTAIWQEFSHIHFLVNKKKCLNCFS